MSQDQVEEAAAAATESPAEMVEELQEKVEKTESISESVSSTVSNALGSVRKSADDALEPLRELSKKTKATLRVYEEEGTPLRKLLKAGRLEINNTYAIGSSRYTSLVENIQDKLETSKAHTGAMLGDVGIKVKGLHDLRRKHPGVLALGMGVVMVLPKLRSGKVVAFRRFIFAAILSPTVVYGANWWEDRQKHKSIR